MTLLVSWIGVDTHGTASAYIAADSRISWPDTRNTSKNIGIFDYGRKVFAFRSSPDILGYCGDVLFPSIILSQITEMADYGLLFSQKASITEKFEIIKTKLQQQFNEYPNAVKSTQLQVLHISRNPNNNLEFACQLLNWDRTKGWSIDYIPIPESSEKLRILGSGEGEFIKNLKRYEVNLINQKKKTTSRTIFHCFCNTLFNIKDKNCGGSPQLVGIYRKPNSSAISFGIIENNKRSFLGIPIEPDVDFTNIEWRNDLFERCDGQTMERIDSAQAQPDTMR